MEKDPETPGYNKQRKIRKTEIENSGRNENFSKGQEREEKLVK